MTVARRDPRECVGPGITVGVVQLAWMFDRSRDWARALLERWERDQKLGGPQRVFRVGRNLYTTRPVIHSTMPPCKDLALYRRIDAIDVEQGDHARRIEWLTSRVDKLEKTVFRGRSGPTEERRAGVVNRPNGAKIQVAPPTAAGKSTQAEQG